MSADLDGLAEDRLLTRIVDRAATPREWDALEELAGREPAAWQRLHAALRDDLVLKSTCAPLLAAADRVDLPAGLPVPRPARGGWFTTLGWAAALFFAALWLGDPPAPALTPPPRGIDATAAGYGRGEIVDELPPDVVEMRAVDNGQIEVVLIRRTLERTRVDSVFELAEDEMGQPRPQPISLRRLQGPRDF